MKLKNYFKVALLASALTVMAACSAAIKAPTVEPETEVEPSEQILKAASEKQLSGAVNAITAITSVDASTDSFTVSWSTGGNDNMWQLDVRRWKFLDTSTRSSCKKKSIYFF